MRLPPTDRVFGWADDGGTVVPDEVREAPVRPDEESGGDAGTDESDAGSVVAIGVSNGESVSSGTVVLAVEALKMEHR